MTKREREPHKRNVSKRISRIALAFAVVCTAGAASSYALESSAPAARGKSFSHHARVVSSHRARVAQAADLDVFRRPLSGSDQVQPSPGLIARATSMGGDLAQAHRVYPSANSTMWIAPATAPNAACELIRPMIFSAVPNGMRVFCVTAADIQDGYSVRAQGVGSHTEVNGLVPNGVFDVTVHQADGGSVLLPVKGNAYDGFVAGPITGVSFDGAAGKVRAPLHSCSATC